MRVYFVGAHSTGKTSLARWVSEKYKVPMISEVARQILAEMEVPLEQLRADLDAINNYQMQVFIRQLAAEKQAGESFVSDRAFDAIAYAAEHSHVAQRLGAMEPLQGYIEWLRQGIVFFVRPHKTLCRADGTRETPYWESILRIDGMIKLLLELYAIPYLPLACESMQERISTIYFVLRPLFANEAAKVKGTKEVDPESKPEDPKVVPATEIPTRGVERGKPHKGRR